TTTTRSHLQSSSQARSVGHDELGNLLWQQDSSEFLEQFPDSRCPVPPLRHCHAPGHAHAHAPNTLSRRNADLFSGDLGIPEISTHVGSVVHTFETLALQRRLAEAEEQDRQDRDRELSKYEASSTQSKYSQLKRRSQEMRQRLVQQMHRQRWHLHQQQQLPQPLPPQLARSRTQSQPPPQSLHEGTAILTNSCSTQTLATPFWPAPQRRSTEQLQHQSTFEDYRKNLFGTLGKHTSVEENEELQDESFIVNAAFDEIFSRYDDEEGEGERERSHTHTQTNTDDLFEDEHMLVSLSELDDEVFASRAATAATTPTNSKAGRTPKHSSPALNQTKYPNPAPAPPRSRTLTNLFDRLKPQDHRLQKYPAEVALNETADFNRGSTVSKSFVQQLRKPSLKQKRAPRPPPKPQSRSQVAIAHVTPLRKALIFPKRSKSSSELLLDDLGVQARKYRSRMEQGSAL
ncbi:hypothetical protein KR009_001859, partial [Drosophila setifemur]